MNADLNERLKNLSPAQRRELLELVKKKQKTNKNSFIPRVTDANQYPASSGQQRIWTLDQLNTEKISPYLIHHTVLLSGAINAGALETALKTLYARHGSLRTRFQESPEGLHQIIEDTPRCVLKQVSLVDSDDSKTALHEAIRACLENPFIEAGAKQSQVYLFSFNKDEHALSWLIHHSICDGQSVDILLKELSQLYVAAEQNEIATLPEIEVRYEDFSAWQKRELDSERGQRAATFWAESWNDLPAPLDLPSVRNRPKQKRFRGAHIHRSLDSSLSRSIETLGAREGCSPFVTLLTAYYLFLNKLSGNNDIFVGCPVAGRLHPSLQGVVGLFVNTLALRARIDPHKSFTDHLHQVRNHVAQALAYQDYPFDRLVEKAQIPRDPSRAPVFDVMFAVDGEDGQAMKLGGLKTSPFETENPISRFDLTFHFKRNLGAYNLDIEYATSLFDEEQIQRWADLFIQLTQSIVDEPTTKVGLLRSIPKSTEDRIFESFCRVEADYPENLGIVELFQEQCRRFPDAPAALYSGKTFSYRWLETESSKLGQTLSCAHGVQPGDIVALIIERSEEMLVALLGILKTGAAYLPLNPDTPQRRIQTILDDADVRLVLGSGERPENLENVPIRWCDVNDLSDNEDVDGLPVRNSAQALAYVMYTSGSTGIPKGVLIEQKSIVRLVKNTDFHCVQTGERVLQAGSLAFDASTFEIWGPLLNGGCCCIPEGKSLLEIGGFDALVRSNEIDTAFLTTGFFNQLVDFSLESFGNLKCILTGGERASLPHFNRLRAAHPDLKILHVYGPTENTTFSSWYPVEAQQTRAIPIGKPIQNSELYILDAFGRSQPIGIPGEIYCGGPGLARGYLKRPALTAKAFIPHPYSQRPGERLYKTGDLGYWDAAGNIIFVGRNDDQVKIRGFRIEIGEIEKRLSSYSKLNKIVVIARPHGGTHELNAYYEADTTISSENLRDWILAELPDYMVPARFIRLEALPLNANGKVDQNALPAPENVQEGDQERCIETPETEQERVLIDCLKSVLNTSAIGRNSNYFHLGGDSIKAIQLGARLKEASYSLLLKDVFAYPVLSHMAKRMQGVRSVTQQPRIRVKGSCRLTAVQQWFVDCHQPPFEPFNQVTLLQSKERLDRIRVDSAIRKIVEHHDAFRLKLNRSESGVYENTFLEKTPSAPCSLIEIDAGDSTKLEAEVRDASETLQKQISIESGHSMCIAILRTERYDLLFWAIHHWVVDGVSWRVLLEDFESLYDDINQAIIPDSLSLPDWLKACNQFLQSELAPPDLSYWKTIQRIPELDKDWGTLREHRFVLPSTLTEQLETTANRFLNTRTNELMLAALGLAWREVFKIPLNLAIESHGRTLPEDRSSSHTAVGWFTAIFPHDLDLRAKDNITEALLITKEGFRSIPYEGIGYGLHKHLADESIPDLGPRVSFNYLGSFNLENTGNFHATDLKTGNTTADHLMRDFPLNWVAAIEGNQLKGHFIFWDGIYSKESIRALSESFKIQCQAIADWTLRQQPMITASDLSIDGLDHKSLESTLQAHKIDLAEIETIWPATSMQAGILYHCLHDSGSGAYVDQINQVVHGEFDPTIFKKTWEILSERQPVLRSHFLIHNTDTPLQIVLRARLFDFEVVPLTDSSNAQQQIEEFIENDRALGFQLESGPLFRISLFKLPGNRWEILITLHHSILDGWSAGILMDECLTIYSNLRKGIQGTLPEPILLDQYHRHLDTIQSEESIDFWRSYVTDAPVGSLPPADGSLWDRESGVTEFFIGEFDTKLVHELETLASKKNITPNTILQLSWALYLRIATGNDDIVFGTTVSGRDIDLLGIEQIVGLLINTLPIRLRNFDQNFETMLSTFFEQSNRSRAHAHIPLSEIQALANGQDLVRHTFIFENQDDADATDATPPFQLETKQVHDPMHFDFGVLVIPFKNSYRVRFVANGKVYSKSQLSSIFNGWQKTLTQCLENPKVSIETLAAAVEPQMPPKWVINSTFTAEALEDCIAHFARGRAYMQLIQFAGFNQIFQELLQPISITQTNTHGVNIFAIRLQDWAGQQQDLDHTALEGNIDTFVDGIRDLAKKNSGAHNAVILCPSSKGIHDTVRDELKRCGMRLAHRLSSISNIDVIEQTFASYPFDTLNDFLVDKEIGAVPYTETGYAALASTLMRRVDLAQRRPVKVIAVDADNTLWKGIIGEGKLSEVSITQNYQYLQKKLSALEKSGVLLALVTKNNPDDIEEALAVLPNMQIKRDQWVSIKASWHPKSNSLKELASELNLGLDSFVFLDDSALEIAEVRGTCPEVLSIQIPNESQLGTFTEHLWLLDSMATTSVDAQRTRQYQEQAQRESFRTHTSNYAEFLAGLGLQLEFIDAEPEHYARASQMSQRTNQFNATSWRVSESELATWLELDSHTLLLVDVKDRFGAYGICGALFIEIDNSALHIRNILLSCRALGRGVEHAMLKECAERYGRDDVQMYWKISAKNAPLTAFYQSLNARYSGDGEKGIFEIASEALTKLDAAQPQTENPSEKPVPEKSFEPITAPYAFYEKIAREYNDLTKLVSDIKKHAPRPKKFVAREYVAPENKAERIVAQVFEDVLGVSKVGKNDHFLELGGHSLKAVMAISRLESQYKRRIELSAFLESPVVCDIAQKLSFGESESILPLPLADTYLASRAQQRLWMLSQIRDTSGLAFHMPITLKIAAPLNTKVLKQSLRILTERHESLRTSFVEIEGKPRMRIHNEPRVDFTAKVDPVSELELKALARECASMPFDLAEAPLMRGMYVPMEGESSALVFVMHHIISDGWSLGILSRELQEIYEQVLGGISVESKPIPIQAKEFAAWQTSYLESAQDDRVFWETMWAELPEALAIPTDHDRPAIKSSQGSVFSAVYSLEKYALLQRFAQERGMSIFSVLLAALQLCVHKYTQSKDFCIGVPVAGRSRPEFERVLGFFVNTLPIRCKLATDMTLEAFLDASSANTRTCLDHQHYPFDLLIESLPLERDPSRAPLFDILFTLQNADMPDLAFDGTPAQVVETDFQPIQYDWVFNTFEDPEAGLNVRLEYDNTLYTRERIEGLLEQWFTTIDALVHKTDVQIADLECLASGQIERLQNYEQGERFGEAVKQSIPALFEEVARQHTANIALSDAGARLSYADLGQRSQEIAQALVERLGYGNHRVALSGLRSADYVLAMLGILRAGYTYVPIDVDYPKERIEYILTNCEASGLITVGNADPIKHLLSIPVWDCHTLNGVDTALPTVDPEAIAYMIYTSGTTGHPKGVQVSHRAFVTMILGQIEIFGVSEKDVCGQFASMAFDASLSEVFLALGSGARLEIMPQEGREDIDAFLQWMERSATSVITLPPPFLRALGKQALGKLRVLISAGEAGDPDILEYHQKSLKVFNAYGPTETAVCGSIYPLGDSAIRPLPIGYPMPSSAVRILDTQGRRVPLGCDGEICISGPTVGAGYWKQEALTAERFIHDPYAPEHMLYRTGDLGRWDTQGRALYRGRIDHQVKIRGYRIETAEIEAVILKVEAVKEAVVIACEDTLVAFVTGNVDSSAVQNRCKDVLPSYMCPSHYQVLDTLPLTPNKKIDRAALTKLFQGVRGTVDSQGSLPETHLEKVVFSAWASLLKTEQIFRESSFFALGGDSIKGLHLISQLRSLGWQARLPDLYTHEQLAAFAETLQPIEKEKSQAQFSDDQDFALSPIQSWFFTQHPHSPWEHFNMALKLRLAPTTQTRKLFTCLRELSVRHVMLRAYFPTNNDGNRVLKLKPASESQIEMIEAEGGRDVTYTGPFDLENGPLIRAILRDGELVLVAHHLIIDWISWRIILSDLESLYFGEALSGSPSPNVANRAQNLLSWAQKNPEDRTYWEQAITTMPTLADTVGVYRDVHVVELESAEAYAAFQSDKKAIQAFLLTVASCAAVDTLKQDSISILMESHGRTPDGSHDDFSDAVSWFTALYPVCISRQPDLRSQLKHSTETLDAVPQQGLGYGVWTELLGTLPRVSATVSLNYLGEFDESSESRLFETFESVLPGTIGASFERDQCLDVSIWGKDGKIHAVVASNQKDTAISFAENLKVYLAQMAALTKTLIVHP